MNPEHKSVKSTDRKYAVLSLATQRSWKGAWNSLGERVAASLRQGDHVLVEGTLVSSSYDREAASLSAIFFRVFDPRCLRWRAKGPNPASMKVL